MKLLRCFNYKLVLGLSNLALTLCGITLLFAGFILFTDSNRILLSRLVGASSETLLNLTHPFFYYIALGLALAGLIAILTSFIGWWATCLNSYCVLSIVRVIIFFIAFNLYFLVVITLLLIEFSICLLITLWPQCLGLNLDESVMVKVLQANYGVPGREQLTASIDLAQTQFKCCAINSDLNYDMSLWRLQSYGQRDWVVPQTCCTLNNRYEARSYLDPKPHNLTMCQSLLKHEYHRARHIDTCIEHLDLWYRQHYTIFLVASTVVAIVEFAVLLSIILSCTRLSARGKRHGNIAYRSTGTTMQSNVLATATANHQPAESRQKRRPAPQPHHTNNNLQKALTALENVYVSGGSNGMNGVNGINGINGSKGGKGGKGERSVRENYVEPTKLPNAYSYHMSKSYLV